jgi:low affinity Fe/Cu permease
MTAVFGSMVCFYILVVWALLPLIPQFSKYQTIILYVSAGIVQLIALPLLAVGQNVQSKASEARMEKMMKHMSSEIDRILIDIEK